MNFMFANDLIGLYGKMRLFVKYLTIFVISGNIGCLPFLTTMAAMRSRKEYNMGSSQGWWESDEAFKTRMTDEINQTNIEFIQKETGYEAMCQQSRESDSEYSDRLTATASNLAIEKETGSEAMCQQWHETDHAYRDRLVATASNLAIEKETGSAPMCQQSRESDSEYSDRVATEANIMTIWRETGREPMCKQRSESDRIYRDRIATEANSLRSARDSANKSAIRSNSGNTMTSADDRGDSHSSGSYDYDDDDDYSPSVSDSASQPASVSASASRPAPMPKPKTEFELALDKLDTTARHKILLDIIKNLVNPMSYRLDALDMITDQAKLVTLYKESIEMYESGDGRRTLCNFIPSERIIATIADASIRERLNKEDVNRRFVRICNMSVDELRNTACYHRVKALAIGATERLYALKDFDSIVYVMENSFSGSTKQMARQYCKQLKRERMLMNILGKLYNASQSIGNLARGIFSR